MTTSVGKIKKENDNITVSSKRDKIMGTRRLLEKETRNRETKGNQEIITEDTQHRSFIALHSLAI